MRTIQKIGIGILTGATLLASAYFGSKRYADGSAIKDFTVELL